MQTIHAALVVLSTITLTVAACGDSGDFYPQGYEVQGTTPPNERPDFGQDEDNSGVTDETPDDDSSGITDLEAGEIPNLLGKNYSVYMAGEYTIKQFEVLSQNIPEDVNYITLGGTCDLTNGEELPFNVEAKLNRAGTTTVPFEIALDATMLATCSIHAVAVSEMNLLQVFDLLGGNLRTEFIFIKNEVEIALPQANSVCKKDGRHFTWSPWWDMDGCAK
ncbi:MAG: hypothetical protein KAZ30_00900 [Candidatus Magasanikbacteria bacterium]|nr:hypothetical protein [Candidatus Magasanikbacteria bacterium]